MRNKLAVVMIIVLSVAVVGCGKKDAVKGKGGDGDVTATGIGDGTAAAGEALADLVARKVIYFEFDSASITEESRQALQIHAQKLSSSGAKVVLEGHADERGTREYNLALGERRAKAVGDTLAAFGVASTGIQTISYGEERPAALEHNESAWRLNRRVELVY